MAWRKPSWQSPCSTPHSVKSFGSGSTNRLWSGTHALQADRFFPSTQLCSHCGYQNKNLSLSDREWVCPECNTRHRRDFNAAQNLREEGIRQLVARGNLETQNACGQHTRLATASHAV